MKQITDTFKKYLKVMCIEGVKTKGCDLTVY